MNGEKRPNAVPDRFGQLYSDPTMDLPVIPRLPMPRLANPPADRQNEAGYRGHYGSNILAEHPVAGTPDRIVIIDKAFPHSIFDLMLLIVRDDDATIASAVDEIDPATLRTLLCYFRAFVAYIRSGAGPANLDPSTANLMIGMNYDPATTDRDNGQWWDKRMHWHLNCWPAETYADVDVVALSQITDLQLRRSLIDPIGDLAANVMSDLVRALPLPPGCAVVAASTHASGPLPAGLKVQIPGWDFLTQPECADLLIRLHQLAARTYQQVAACFTHEHQPPQPWSRPQLLAAPEVQRRLQELPWLAPEAVKQLMLLRGLLRDITPRQMDLLRENMRAANHCMMLAGLDYHLGFWTRPVHHHGGDQVDGEVLILMQFKFLSAIGSSPAIGRGVASILDRFSGPVMTPGDMDARRQFQAVYLAQCPGPSAMGTGPR